VVCQLKSWRTLDLGDRTSVTAGTQTTADYIVHPRSCSGLLESPYCTVGSRTDVIKALLLFVGSSHAEPKISNLHPSNADSVWFMVGGSFLLSHFLHLAFSKSPMLCGCHLGVQWPVNKLSVDHNGCLLKTLLC
jgi:hypothetical protein